jgi:hypothetical protein
MRGGGDVRASQHIVVLTPTAAVMHGGTFLESATSEEWTIDGHAHACHVRVRADGMRKSVYRSYYFHTNRYHDYCVAVVQAEACISPESTWCFFGWSVELISCFL